MSDEEHRFMVRIDDGEPIEVVARTGIYIHVVLALPAMLGVERGSIVEIWVPSLLPAYGPYLYRIDATDRGLEAAHLIRTKAA